MGSIKKSYWKYKYLGISLTSGGQMDKGGVGSCQRGSWSRTETHKPARWGQSPGWPQAH